MLENSVGAGWGLGNQEGWRELKDDMDGTQIIVGDSSRTARTTWLWLGNKGLFLTLGYIHSRGLCETGLSPVMPE